MEALADWLIAFVSAENNLAGLAIMAAAAAIEYLVPPFPGDTITLLGAILISAYDWSFPAVFAAVMLGSVAGSMAAFWLGTRWRRSDKQEAEEENILDALVSKFRQRGAVYLVINRFVPGIRALFFVAAGMAGMRALPVALYSAISAALWHLALIAAGATLGANLETLQYWVSRYTLVVAAVVAVLVSAFVLRWWMRRPRRDS